MTDLVNFYQADWLSGTLFYCVKEFVSVFFQLFCYSRIGAYDFFNGALILFVTLVVLDFPFLSPYLLGCMRFGPGGTFPLLWNFFGALGQTAVIVLCQCAGAAAAAVTAKQMKEAWPNATLFKNNITLVESTVYDESQLDKPFVFFEEFFAVFVLLVGLIHLTQCNIPSLLKLNTPEISTDKPAISDAQKHVSIPIGMITSAAILVAGVTRAFPSAHQAMHVTVFAMMRGYDSDRGWIRIGGGLLGTIASVIYYHAMFTYKGYIYSFAEPIRGNKDTRNPLPAFMYSKVLTSEFARMR